MKKEASNFRALGTVSAAVGFLGMYLDVKHSMAIGKVVVVLGFLVTGITYVSRRKQNNRNSKVKLSHLILALQEK